jgi:glycosyl-4,4'-diaponeurosporenoate acyltransferase
MFPLIEVPLWLLIVLNVISWPIFHLAIAQLTVRIPDKAFLNDAFVTKVNSTLQAQQFYEQVLLIRVWKKWIPDGATIFKFGFRKKNMEGHDINYMEKFILETRRAEFSHLVQILPALIFFVFNTLDIALIMTVYAFAFNVPLILLQRYNRIRFLRILKRN